MTERSYKLAVNAVRTGRVVVWMPGYTLPVDADSFGEAASKVCCEPGMIRKFTWAPQVTE